MRVGLLVGVTLLAGCGGDEPQEPCRPGFLPAADGHCYPRPPETEPPSVEDALEALPACFLHKPIGDIDLEGGCADGACAGSTIASWESALGKPDVCDNPSFSNRLSSCVWEQRGIEGLFDDDDEDGQPDDDSRSERVHLLPGHPGSTVEGLGTDQQVRCWIDVLGFPEEVTFERIGGTLLVEELWYDDLGVQVNDWETDDGPDNPDGLVDNVFLFGPP